VGSSASSFMIASMRWSISACEGPV
jgi:hypothetical protein